MRNLRKGFVVYNPQADESTKSAVGERIREFRVRKSLLVSELARRVEVSVSTLREWENGRSIHGESYSRLAHELGVHVLELVEIERLLQAAKQKC